MSALPFFSSSLHLLQGVQVDWLGSGPVLADWWTWTWTWGSGPVRVRTMFDHEKKQNFVILQYILQRASWTRYKQSEGLLDHEPAYSVLQMHLLFETVRLCADARYEVHQCADQHGTRCANAQYEVRWCVVRGAAVRRCAIWGVPMHATNWVLLGSDPICWARPCAVLCYFAAVQCAAWQTADSNFSWLIHPHNSRNLLGSG